MSSYYFIKIESIDDDGLVLPERLAHIDEDTHRILRRSQLSSQDVLFSIAGALGRVALVPDRLLPANINQALAFIRLKKLSAIDPHYLVHYLSSNSIRKHIGAINVQAAQANLSLEQVRDFEIRHPELPEQRAIAEVLSHMDAELTALEQRRNKTVSLKQGMMQELLTGRIRLI